MKETLTELADTVKDSEYKDLFPNTSVEEAKKDEDKVKEALFQVHYLVWNEDLYKTVYEKVDDRYQVPVNEIEEMCSDKEFERVQKCLKGATLAEEDGETVVPKTDLKDVLSTRKGLLD
jgi:site-specific DNA-adenine methylase